MPHADPQRTSRRYGPADNPPLPGPLAPGITVVLLAWPAVHCQDGPAGHARTSVGEHPPIQAAPHCQSPVKLDWPTPSAALPGWPRALAEAPYPTGALQSRRSPDPSPTNHARQILIRPLTPDQQRYSRQMRLTNGRAAPQGNAVTISTIARRRPVKNGVSTRVCRRARAPRRQRTRSTSRCRSSASNVRMNS